MTEMAAPPGSNLLCNDNNKNDVRIRKEWDHLDNYDRALYLDAIETAIERGLHQRFAIFHLDERSEIQAHDTCGFYLWHRAFLLAYENMLRSLEPRFACLTLPFWDIYRDYQKQESPLNRCRSYATCSKIINDLGGIVENDDFQERTFFGQKVDGHWHFQPPLQNLRDDHNQVGVIRYDMWFDPIPETVPDVLSVENIARVFATKNRVAFWEVLHHGIHDSIHDTIGGFMRTPTSPIDPLFMPWHSTMELFDYVWEACHSSSNGNNDYNGIASENGIGEQQSIDDSNCVYTPKATKHFPNISLFHDEVYMKLDNATTDIRDDPWIGSYFSQAMKFSNLWTISHLDQHNRFSYANLPQNFVLALQNNTQACPNGLSSIVDSTDNDDNSEKREPPRFSNEKLNALKQEWIIEAQDYYSSDMAAPAKEYPSLDQEGKVQRSNPNGIQQMDFVECILFEAMDRDTIERWAIDEGSFLKQVVVNERYKTHPLCQDRLFSASASVDESGDVDDFPSAAPSATIVSSGGVCHRGASNTSYWFSILLLIYLVSQFSR